MDDVTLHRHLVNRQGSRRDLNTPCLLVDIDALDRNIGRMAAFAAANGLKLRPHAKTHKSVEVARRQIVAGACGVCCAKIGEAEVLAEGGITALHITSPVVSAPAIDRLMRLATQSDQIMVVVDNLDNVASLARAATETRLELDVIIDIDPGMRRTGVASAAAAVDIARAARSCPSLRYRGVQFYCGIEQHIESFEARRIAVAMRTDYLREVIQALTADGAPPEIVTGGGTGTHEIDAELGVFTELQVGSYVFMDAQYLACGVRDVSGPPYETALFVDTRVVSVNAVGLVTVDGGLKAFASEAGPPVIVAGAPEGSAYVFMGDEHGAIMLPAGSVAPRLGDIVSLRAPHCDPTVNLYDTYHVVSGDTLKALWPVSARGRSR
jgi:D-serine deaminase-like pyridoxal phosphate-dependent protein